MKRCQSPKGTLQVWLLFLLLPHLCESWTQNIPFTTSTRQPQRNRRLQFVSLSTENTPSSSTEEVEIDILIEMDVVIYSKKDDVKETRLVGALQEDGSLAPLSAWTTNPAFENSIEFLVDEEDRFSLDANNVKLHYLLNESEMSFGSRQCYRGVGNPHGEDIELLYYVDQPVIDKFDVKVILKPGLEILR